MPRTAATNPQSNWGALNIDLETCDGVSGVIQEIVCKGAMEVLQAHQMAPRPASDTGDLTLASIIGFSGEDIQGALGMATTHQTLSAAHLASTGRKAGPGEENDWLRELANQVMGRVKGGLLAQGVKVTIALPQTVQGMCLSPDERRRNRVAWTSLHVSGGLFLTWVDLEVFDGLRLGGKAAEMAVPAGELLLF